MWRILSSTGLFIQFALETEQALTVTKYPRFSKTGVIIQEKLKTYWIFTYPNLIYYMWHIFKLKST